jgi:hypothetical protein
MPRARLQGGEQFELAQAVEEKCHHDFESRQEGTSRKEGTGQISGESEGKRRWNEHRGCKPSSSEAGRRSLGKNRRRNNQEGAKPRKFCRNKGQQHPLKRITQLSEWDDLSRLAGSQIAEDPGRVRTAQRSKSRSNASISVARFLLEVVEVRFNKGLIVRSELNRGRQSGK